MADPVDLSTVSGFLNPVSRHVISGWARDLFQPDRVLTVDLSCAPSGLRIRLRADLPSGGSIGTHRFVCHLNHGLSPGETIHGQIVETSEALAGGPRTVTKLETPLALFSTRHDYLVYYSAKSACTWLRSLFTFLHHAEAKAPLDPHNLPPAFPPDPAALPATSLAVVRDPALRIISSFLDKVASWVYEPRISRAEPILRWRFGDDQARYSELTFLDFLAYLTDGPSPGDEHFWPQPIYLPEVRIARVESLDDDIRAFYANVRPALLDDVERFLLHGKGRRNASRNTTLPHRTYQAGAEAWGIGELAAMIRSGTGFDSRSFLGAPALERLEAMVSRERDAYGYPAPASHNPLSIGI